MQNLSKEEYVTYSKQIILDNIGIEGQKRLKDSKVLVIGAGGLGCPVVTYLAISGIGCIGVMDQDTIELSNLNRQILYSSQEIGKFKTHVTKVKITQINKNCRLIEHRYNLNEENSLEIISCYDIIVDTTDNFTTRYNIDKMCYQLHKVCIYGAINGFEGQTGVFNYKNGIRYANIYTQKLELLNASCNRSGIIGINSGYVGIIQATETIKLILGLSKNCKNFIALHNSLKNITKQKKIYCTRLALSNVKKQNIDTKMRNIILKNNLRMTRMKFLLIDLRRNKDFKVFHERKSINIPLTQFKIHKTIHLIKKNIQNKTLIIYCSRMERSIIASTFLTNYNVKHYILKEEE